MDMERTLDREDGKQKDMKQIYMEGADRIYKDQISAEYGPVKSYSPQKMAMKSPEKSKAIPLKSDDFYGR